MEWGRLLYDPETPDRVFENAFDRKYGPGVGEKLFKAWEAASIAPLRFAQITPSSWDYTLYQEGFMSGIDYDKKPWEPQFFSLDDLINAKPLDDDYVNVRDWVDQGAKATGDKVTPLELARELETRAAEARSLIKDLPSEPASLQCETIDVETWVNYGLYFSNKLRGAVAKAQGEAGQSRSYMRTALEHWVAMIRLNDQHNRPKIADLRNPHGTFSWRDQLGRVRSEAGK